MNNQYLILQNLFQQALDHRSEHGCSAYPYESYNQLFDIVTNQQPTRILEIGTGVGFTTCVMALACPKATIDTVEKDSVHAQIANEFILTNLNLLDVAPAKITVMNDIAELVLPDLQQNYDLIFFDGYQIHYEFLPQYERLLNRCGVLVLANTQLSSKTSEQFFTELHNANNWQILQKFADTIVAKRT